MITIKYPIPLLLQYGIVCVLTFQSACSFLVDSERVQCSQDLDCVNRGESFVGSVCLENLCKPNPSWACLATKRVPDGPGPYKVTVPGAADVVSQQPIPGATIRVCRKLDVTCSNPVSSQTITSSQGVTFTLENGFSGYLQAEAENYLPSLYFFNPPIDRDQSTIAIPVANQMEYAALLAVLGVTPNPQRGTAIFQAFDCTGNTAAGISYSTINIDTQAKAFYYSGGLPSPVATETDSFGYGGVANLPAGSLSVNAHLSKPSANLATISLIVRPQTLSFALVAPYKD
jgi:hypothetical protein